MPCPSAARLTLALALVVPILAVPAARADERAAPPAITIVVPAGDVSLTAAANGPGTAHLVVRNDSDTPGTPTARVVGDKGSAPLGASRGVVATPSPATLAPGAVGALDLAVTGHPKLSGRLVVGLQDAKGRPVDGVREAIVGISVEQPAKDKVAGQPAEPTLDLVRHCLVRKLGIHFLCGGEETTRVWITGVPRTTIRRQKIRGIGSGDGGQSAVALLRPAGTAEADDLPGPLKPTYKAEAFAQATAHGDYKALLTLDPGSDEPTQMTVAVRARDWAGWALLLLIVGAYIGYRTHVFYDARRARRLLQLRLLTVRERYAAARPHAHPRMPALQSLFGPLDADAPEVPDEQACAAAEKTGFVELYCQVDDAASSGDAAAFEAAVADAEGQVDRWVDVDRAMRHLQAAYDAVPADERTSAFMTDTEAQLDLVEVPADQAATDKLVTALEGHRVLMGHYRATRELFVGHQADEALDPAKIYRKHFKAKARIAERTPGQMQALEADLAEARAALAQLPQKPVAGRLLLAPERVDELAAAGEPLPEPVERKEPVTAAALRSSIMISDKAIFWVTLVIAAVVYLATLYAGKPWGSEADWVTAFAAGYGGQLLAGVAVFPAVRSLMEKVAPAKA